MHVPIKGFKNALYPAGSVTQYFGENKELYSRVVCKDDGGIQYCLQGHNGVDIVAPWGTPIYAVEDALVVTVKNSPEGYGKYIKTLNFDLGHEWTYGHLSRIDVAEGQSIKAGDQIGLMGNTGFVISGDTPYWKNNPYAGTHLHLGLRLVENKNESPRTTYGNGIRAHVKDWRNGFYGAVDWITLLWKDDDNDMSLIGMLKRLVLKLTLLRDKLQEQVDAQK